MSTTLAELLEKYKKGTITPAEWQLLREAVASDGFRGVIEEDILLLLRNGSPDASFKDREVILQKILAADEPVAPVHRVHFLRRSWVRYAAAVLILVGAGWFLSHREKSGKEVAAGSMSTIKAARNGAVLTLGDGRTVTLDSSGDRTVAAQGGVQAMIQNGRLVYQPSDVKDNGVFSNTVMTNKGTQFHVELPDGTTVYLNAGTVIRYPTAFVGKERRIEVSGEAYFEVAKNARQPFIVTINKETEIEVLGTSFNVNGYKDENTVDATLVEGSIRVVKESQSVMVKPGQQARAGEKITLIPDADVDKALAWKNGIFNFEGVGLHEMMRQLERWYDIEVVYEKNVPDIQFFGKISRKLDLATVLEALKGFGLHYEMKENRKLIVM